MRYTNNVLDLAGVPIKPANQIKCCVYLCFAQLALLHDLSPEKTRPFTDVLVHEAKSVFRDYKARISNLARSEAELGKILSGFPEGLNMSGNDISNGLGLFEAVYFSSVIDVVTEMVSKTDGPMGVSGIAAIRLLEALRGEGNGRDGLIPVSMMLKSMTADIIENLH